MNTLKYNKEQTAVMYDILVDDAEKSTYHIANFKGNKITVRAVSPEDALLIFKCTHNPMELGMFQTVTSAQRFIYDSCEFIEPVKLD